MTARAEYTDDEWTLLRMTPFATGMAVVFADGPGLFETFREAVALVREVSAGPTRHEGNELIAALMAHSFDPGAPEVRPVTPEMAAAGPDRIAAETRRAGLDHVARARALLDERSSETESLGYRQWVMDVARAVATATRHGGRLSGGPLVDRAECEILGEIADALGVEEGQLPAGSCGDPDAGPDGT
jgi:hypothetical protein